MVFTNAGASRTLVREAVAEFKSYGYDFANRLNGIGTFYSCQSSLRAPSGNRTAIRTDHSQTLFWSNHHIIKSTWLVDMDGK